MLSRFDLGVRALEDLALILQEMGVVGAGGAGFPTYAKLRKEGINEYIANGAECEPLLWVTKELLAKKIFQFLEGFKILVDYVGAKRGVIALKGKYSSIVKLIKDSLSERNYAFDIFECGDYYPEGDEHVLVYEILRRPVPAAGIPIMVGAVVNNVETIYNVYRAFVERAPVIDKFITIGGDVRNPVTVRVPVGIKVKEVLDIIGINYDGKVLIEGGPMTGRVISPDVPVTKTTGGILIFEKGHPAVSQFTAPLDYILKRARTCCIQCRYCTDQCPRYLLGHDLEPHRIMISMAFDMGIEVRKSALLCSECGVCEAYSCPQLLSPRRVNQYIKAKLIQEGVRYPPKADIVVREDREYRKVPTKRLMMRIGIYEFDRYAPLLEDRIEAKEVTILMKQHIGVPATPIVSVGDYVVEGDVLGKVPEGKLGVNVHASISGKVISVSDEAVVIKGERKNG
ncbi:MAG: 4Fe-4S dicluster domain-containing protein [Synergistetes bacterium]|nr:4Fe-4S dicluster domain-containing protein [Synergistota bacterium]MCX8127758.1 4Fe-4S dicluster domain-containing protein [Synergistota bacterium]MDW8191326.1 4Fe-4S dicluster domain-containing protein [Synergistota bacterium]